jgi:hypothetical protein
VGVQSHPPAPHTHTHTRTLAPPPRTQRDGLVDRVDVLPWDHGAVGLEVDPVGVVGWPVSGAELGRVDGGGRLMKEMTL